MRIAFEVEYSGRILGDILAGGSPRWSRDTFKNGGQHSGEVMVAYFSVKAMKGARLALKCTTLESGINSS